MFNAYAQAINKRYSRSGSLFEKPFERKRILDENYLRQIVLYIHNNPIHHRVFDKIEEYKWSSYNTIMSSSPTKIKRKEIINLFDTVDNYIFCHKNYNYINLGF